MVHRASLKERPYNLISRNRKLCIKNTCTPRLGTTLLDIWAEFNIFLPMPSIQKIRYFLKSMSILRGIDKRRVLYTGWGLYGIIVDGFCRKAKLSDARTECKATESSMHLPIEAMGREHDFAWSMHDGLLEQWPDIASLQFRDSLIDVEIAV